MTEKSTNASFKKRNDSSLEACYRDIFREMKQLVDGPDVYAEDGVEKVNGKVIFCPSMFLVFLLLP